MNFKKIIQECQLINSFLSKQGFNNTRLVVMKILAMLITKTASEQILAKAVLHSSITDSIFQAAVSKTSFSDKAGFAEVQESIARLAGQGAYDPTILGIVYEKLLTARKQQGVFYTPQEVINFILAQTVMQADIVANPWLKILDLSCGSGFFLLGAYDVLWEKYSKAKAELKVRYPDNNWSDAGIHRHILEKNLFGIDIDSEAVDITRASLLLKNNSDKTISLNIAESDSLQSELRPGYERNTFNYVIGNPPYVSFGLRGTGILEKDYKAYLKKNFNETAEYKLSYYAMFLQKGIEMLCQGGSLGYIVPDSFLLGRYYSKIRQYIMKSTWIKGLAHISFSVFKNVSVGYLIICILQKNSNSSELGLQTNTYKINSMADLSISKLAAVYPQSYFSQLPYNRFRMYFSNAEKRLIEKIEAGSMILRNFASGHTGIRSKFTQKALISSSKLSKNYKRGLISGGQLVRYGIIYQGNWLNIDEEILYKGGWQEDIISSRKILIRQTADTLTAAIDDNGLYHLNNIHSFALKNTKVTLDYLLLILNSRLMSYYYHVVSIEYGRSMAQTDIETLELLPINVDDIIDKQAGELAQRMQELISQVNKGDKSIISKVQIFDEYIDQLIYRIYALSDEEIEYIKKHESALRKNMLNKTGVYIKR